MLVKIFIEYQQQNFFCKNIFFRGIFLIFSSYYIQHCFVYRLSDSTVPPDAGIVPRTVATGALALAVRRSNHLVISHPQNGSSQESVPLTSSFFIFRHFSENAIPVEAPGGQGQEEAGQGEGEAKAKVQKVHQQDWQKTMLMAHFTNERVQIDWQWPLVGAHSIMMVNSAQPGLGGECNPSPIYHHEQSCGVRSS
jgi:hypothetical protein